MITLNGSLFSTVSSESSEFVHLRDIATRLAAKDSMIWGDAAAPEAKIRLNWIDLPESSRQLLPQLDALSAWAREHQLNSVILCGMGGSSLAPEVIAATYGKKLTVLDSTDPLQVLDSLPKDLSHSVIVIGSKSGSTIETASQKSFFVKALHQAGLSPVDHIVIVTDPGSPLDLQSRADGLRVINADPHVGGRFSALSAFGLTPSALLGIDVSVLLDDALDASREFTNASSPVVKAALALATLPYVGFTDRGSNVPGISDWIEQLIAESTGKDGRGLLPVVLNSVDEPVGGGHPVVTFDGSGVASIVGPLGAQFIFWEWVTALLGYLLKVDPFNQPNVTEAKTQTLALLDRWHDGKVHSPEPSAIDGVIEIYSDSGETTVLAALKKMQAESFIAVMAYLNRMGESEIAEIRNLLAAPFNAPVTFGWGPRFLHSTGQFHKGGPQVGGFISITGAVGNDVEIPGVPYSFATLEMAQALGDCEALAKRQLPVVRFHLRDRKTGIAQLLKAARSL